MRSILFVAACIFFAAPAAKAASLGMLMPRVQLSSMFEVERNSAGGSGGSRGADAKLGAAAVSPAQGLPEESDEQSREPVDPATAPERHRGGPLDPPRPRWKSMMPGALK